MIRTTEGEPSRMSEQEQITMARDGDGLRPSVSSAETDGLRAAASSRRSTSRTQDIDRHAGARIRERRIMLGLTQQQLADLIGVTYQQAHKYERGINRVSAVRLFEIAQALRVPVAYFFEGLDAEAGSVVGPRERMCLELARNFSQIPNEKHQEAL